MTDNQYDFSRICAEVAEYKKTAEANEIPVAADEVIDLISVFIECTDAKNILELGTAVGVSAMMMACAAGSGCRVITVERDDASYIKASSNIIKFGLPDLIKCVHAEAAEFLKNDVSEYDLIFLDCAKAQYPRLLDDCARLLKKSGVLIADDVNFRGMVDGSSGTQRRKVTIVKRLREFTDKLNSREDLISSVLDIGEGVSVSIKL